MNRPASPRAPALLRRPLGLTLALALGACGGGSSGGGSTPDASPGDAHDPTDAPMADAAGDGAAVTPDAGTTPDVGATSDQGASGDAAATTDATAQTDAAVGPDAAIPADAPLLGGFEAQIMAPVPAYDDVPETPGYTQFIGRVYDGPTPDLIVWEEAEREGGCRLLTPRVPFCETACGGHAACVEDNTCQSYPTAQDVGSIHVHGALTPEGTHDFDASPVAHNYQQQLPYAAFVEGDVLQIRAEGGDTVPAFSVASRGIAPLSLLDAGYTLADGMPFPLTWTPAADAGNARILVKLDISHHGGARGKIECELDDTGAYTLPASLASHLLALGVAGYPTVIVTRRAVESVALSTGRVDFGVSSQVERAVDIPGLVSCFGDEDCPVGQTCQVDLTCL